MAERRGSAGWLTSIVGAVFVVLLGGATVAAFLGGQPGLGAVGGIGGLLAAWVIVAWRRKA